MSASVTLGAPTLTAQPLAILLCGLGGSGKSTVATHLKERLQTKGLDPILVRFDDLRKELAPPRSDPFSSRPAVKQRIWRRAATHFRLLLSSGRPLIVDSGLSNERIRVQMKRSVPGLRIVYLACPLFVAIIRDTKRSLFRVPHERGRFLHLHALLDLVNPWRSEKFPQPGITYAFDQPKCADLRVSTLFREPRQIADEIIMGLGL